MELEGSSNGESSVAFLERLRERHGGRLGVIWDNAPAPLRQAQEGSGDAVIPGDPRPEPAAGYLPGYSPDFNGDEAIWGWAREEATGNLCLGTKALVLKRVNQFRSGLASRNGEVKRRCRTVLQSGAEALLRDSQPDSGHTPNAHPTLALV